MVTRVRQEPHLQARWLTGDEWYGRTPTFLDQVAATGLSYLAEVPHDTQVWPLQVWPLREPASQAARAHPQRWVPPRPASGKGRRPTRERLHPDSPPPVRVDQLARQLSADAWHRYRILEGSKGPLVADFAAMRAVATRDGLPGPEVGVLFRRAVRDPADTADPPELKAGTQGLPEQCTRRHAPGRAGSGEWNALADRVLFRRKQRRVGPGPLRAALLARLAPPYDAGDPGAPLRGPVATAAESERGGPASSQPSSPPPSRPPSAPSRWSASTAPRSGPA